MDLISVINTTKENNEIIYSMNIFASTVFKIRIMLKAWWTAMIILKLTATVYHIRKLLYKLHAYNDKLPWIPGGDICSFIIK